MLILLLATINLHIKLKDVYLEARLDESSINNHGLRASGISRLYTGVPEKLIMERSNHTSIGGVRSYERDNRCSENEYFLNSDICNFSWNSCEM